ncbi:hypothetical protein ABPG75_009586 [Micractinium tetrahymenae]
MAALPQFADTLGLANRPSAPNAVQWSADGVLAVAAGSSIVLASPVNLQGPRAFASPGALDVSVLQAPGQPADPTADAHHEVAHLRVAAMVSQYPALQAALTIRSMSWSPAGCSQAAGCLLATVASDHQVLVFGPPAGPKSEWQTVADLSQQLLDHLQATGWRDLEQPASLAAEAGAAALGAAGDGGVLRLRGGGKRKRPAQKREVTEAEGGEHPPAEDGGQLPTAAAAAAAPEGAAPALAAAEPAAAAGQAQPVFHPEGAFEAAVGQAVEVMSPEEGLVGSWFSGTIRELRQDWALVAYDELKESDAEDSPPLLEWFPLPGQPQGPAPEPRPPGEVHGPASGAQLRPAPPPEECSRGGTRRVGDICDCLIEGAWWEACRVVAVRDAKKKGGGALEVLWGEERKEVPRADARSTLRFAGGRWEPCTLVDVDGEAAGGDGAQPSMGGTQQQKQGKDSPAKKQRAVKAGASEKAAAVEAGPDGEAAGEEPPTKKRRSSKTQKAAAGAAAEAAAQAAQAPAHAPPAAAGGAAEAEQPGLSTAAAAEAAAPAAAAAAPSASAAEAADAAEALMAAAASAPPTTGGKAKGKKAAAAAGASAKKTPARAASAPYEVPADFDGSVLPAVDASTVGRAKSSAPLAFARRFLTLRQEVPAEELPTYPAKSSHLKGCDLELLSRTVAEIMHVHGAALAALDAKMDAKWLDVQGRQKLRHVWDRTNNTLLGKFKIAEDETSEEEEETESEREAEEEEEGANGADGAPRKRAAAGRTGSAPAQLDFPPHELPEDFCWRDLPGVDPSNESSAKRTLVLAAVRRFLTLRREYPAEELPSYPKTSTHLKGHDLWLQDRVTREFITAYSQLLMDLKWTVKAFQTYWGARLRQKWNRMDNRMESGFSLDPEPVEPDVLLAVGEQSVAPSAVDLPALAATAEAADAAASPAGAAAAAALEGEATPGPSAAATPAVGRGPRLLKRPSAKRPDSAATGTASKSKRRAAQSQEGGDESDLESAGTGLTASAVRKRKELAASTAKARSRQGAAGTLSSAAYERRLLGVSALSCAWSPAIMLPSRAAAEAAAASSGSRADAAAGTPAAAAAGAEQQQQQQQQQQQEGQQQDGRCCFLAVGAKAGRIWLWRYRLPQHYSVDQPQGSVGEAFQLVACLPGPTQAWATSLAWQLLPGAGDSCCGSLVLAAGYSDGSVILHGADARQLAGLPLLATQHRQQNDEPAAAAEAVAAVPMQRWAEACPPDQREVTTLALQLCPDGSARHASSSQGRHRLLVAAGKAAGSLAAWCSGRLSGSSGSAEHAKQLGSGAAGLVACSVQGTRVVTGLAWLPHQQRQEGQPLLLASTQEGAVVCYRLAGAGGGPSDSSSSSSGGGLALVWAAGSPQPCLRRKKKEQGHCALGLAVSPGGLFVAVARLSLSPLAEMVKSLQIHERVVQGLLQLDCLAGPDAPLEPEAALDAALAALAGQAGSSGGGSTGGSQAVASVPVLPAAAAWEVASLLHLLARQAASPEAGLVPPLAVSVLERLEQPAHAAVQAATQGQQRQQGQMEEEDGEEEAAVLPQVPADAWRSLQLATALRHVLDPARVVRGQEQRAKKQPKKVGGTAAAPPLLPIPLTQTIKPEDGLAEGQQQQAAQVLSPEQLAQHGAFASLMLAAQQPPQPQQPQQPAPTASTQQQQQRGEEAEEEGGEGQPQLLADWQAATERNEMLLLQRQLAASLMAALPDDDDEEDGGERAQPMQLDGVAAEGAGGGCADGGNEAGADARRSQLLMADWITLNVQDPQLLPEMLPLAARAYMHHGEEIPAEMPARETSMLFCGAPLAVAGAGVAAAASAPAEGAALPRCPASLLLCERRPQWSCGACGRKYQRPAAAAAVADAPACAPAVPACIFCGLPLGLSRPGVLFSPPCCG